MNIILITPKLDKPCLYHTDIINTLSKLYNVYQYGPGFSYFSQSDTVHDIISKSGFTPNLIIFGTAQVLYGLNIRGLPSIKIPKLIFLNKEYQWIDRKLDFIKKNKFNLVTTILNKEIYTPWERLTGIRFVQTPHGIFPDKFPNLNITRKYDLGFLGALFDKQGVSFRKKAKEFIFDKSNLSEKYNIMWGDDYNKKLFSGEEYIRALNSFKISVSTLSPSKIIGLRFYELACVGTMILAPRDNYDGAFVDGKTCVMYDDSVSSFKEKFLHYLDNEKERNNIVNNAYKYVTTECTWDIRIKNLIKNFE